MVVVVVAVAVVVVVVAALVAGITPTFGPSYANLKEGGHPDERVKQ